MASKALWRQARSVPGTSRGHQARPRGPAWPSCPLVPAACFQSHSSEAAERSATTQGSSLHPKEPCTYLMVSECVYHEDTVWWPVPEPMQLQVTTFIPRWQLG